MALKNAGLSHLADVANEADHYPVKKRWEPRRLNPNYDAIRWLEEATHEATKIAWSEPDRCTDEELQILHAEGADVRNYNRPMFQVLPRDAFSGMGALVTPCMACDRFDRSWACEEHPEVEWDHDLKRWKRPGLVPPTAYASPVLPGSIFQMMSAQIEAAYRREPCTCNLCQARRGFSAEIQNDGQGELREGRWRLPSFEAGEIVTSGRNRPIDLSQYTYTPPFQEIRPYVPPTPDYDPVEGLSTGGMRGILGLGAVPDTIEEETRRRVAALPDGTIVLHVEGDSSSFEIEVRPNDS